MSTTITNPASSSPVPSEDGSTVSNASSAKSHQSKEGSRIMKSVRLLARFKGCQDTQALLQHCSAIMEAVAAGDRRRRVVDQLFENPLMLSYFSAYCREHFCDENVRAFAHMQHFERLFGSGSQLETVPQTPVLVLHQMVRKIYNLHIAPSADAPICLKSKTRAAIEVELRKSEAVVKAAEGGNPESDPAAAAEADPPPENMFAVAMQELAKDMRMDTFPRFLTSTQSKRLQAAVLAFRKSGMIERGAANSKAAQRYIPAERPVAAADASADGSRVALAAGANAPGSWLEYLRRCTKKEVAAFEAFALKQDRPQWVDGNIVWSQIQFAKEAQHRAGRRPPRRSIVRAMSAASAGGSGGGGSVPEVCSGIDDAEAEAEQALGNAVDDDDDDDDDEARSRFGGGGGGGSSSSSPFGTTSAAAGAAAGGGGDSLADAKVDWDRIADEFAWTVLLLDTSEGFRQRISDADMSAFVEGVTRLTPAHYYGLEAACEVLLAEGVAAFANAHPGIIPGASGGGGAGGGGGSAGGSKACVIQ